MQHISGSILVINAGSSSIKFAIFSIGEEGNSSLQTKYRGTITGIGRQAHFDVFVSNGPLAEVSKKLLTKTKNIQTHADAFSALFDWIDYHIRQSPLIAVGHRVVHGAEYYSTPVIVNKNVLHNIKSLIPLAPLHQPYNIAAIEILLQQKIGVPQIACFDTAFHRTQPFVAQQFALPRALQQYGIQRYGFHGLSYHYIANVLPDYLGEDAKGRVIVAHLGHGASLCAIKAQRSVATTMSFSPLDGLPMGTRCGALDPTVVFYLVKEKGMELEMVADLLNNKSGLLGVSGISDDMRELINSDDPHAREALDLFVYRVGREIGSLAAAMGGLDALVFTAGIGEHSAVIRHRICEQTAWLGLRVDETKNSKNGPIISAMDSDVSAWVIPTNEELVIAEQTTLTIRSDK